VRGGFGYSTLGAVGNPNYLRQSAHLTLTADEVAELTSLVSDR
jgi:hypothetical protein